VYPKAVSWGHYYTCYTLQTSNLNKIYTEIFEDDVAVLATDSDPATASHKLQTNLDVILKWLKKCRKKAIESK
jgi:hypothetical protein